MILKPAKDGCFFAILNKEDKLIEKLTLLLSEHKIRGGVIAGIGALKDVELGYYDLEEQTYLRKTFAGEDFELLSLNGNLSLKENKPYIHAHVILGRRDFSTFGGHLFEATVAVTAEITVIPLQKMPIREMNAEIGLALMCGFKD